MLAYLDDQPVGWCSVGPREAYSALERSRIFKRVDNKPVWSIVCFFVVKTFRCQGITSELIGAAVDYARNNSVEVVEAYPVDPADGRYPDIFAYTGFLSAFRNAGFTEVIRRSKSRPIVRLYL